MATRLLPAGGTDKPFSPGRLAVATGRILTIVVSLVLVSLTRSHNKFDSSLIVAVGVLIGLYLAFGRKGETRGLILYIIATCAFEQIRVFADQTGVPIHYAYVINMDRAVFGVLPNHWVQQQLYHPGHTTLVTIYATAVYLSFFLNLQLSALVVWAKWRTFFVPYATAVVVAAFIGLLVCVTLPTAPPWLAAKDGYAPEVHRVVEEASQKVDSNAYANGAKVAGDNPVAAMPSLHMALSALVMLAVFRFSRNRLLRGLSVLYVASMGFALVYLGEHYVSDEFFGIVTAVVAWNCGLWLGGVDGRRVPLPAFLSRRRKDQLQPATANP